jgi:hypothetical protein
MTALGVGSEAALRTVEGMTASLRMTVSLRTTVLETEDLRSSSAVAVVSTLLPDETLPHQEGAA